MDKVTQEIYLTFDDVLLKPGKSLASRNTAKYDLYWEGLGDIHHPIIPANMDTVAGLNLCDAQLKSGGIAILHRFMSIKDRIEAFNDLEENPRLFITVGINENDRLARLYSAGIRNFCLDIAHAHSDAAFETIRLIKALGDDTIVIAGNIATPEAANFLMRAGADFLKVGIGPGSHCTTRIVTGCGVPQLSAILEIAKWRDQVVIDTGLYIPIIGDGGLKNSGDITKALASGADFVMSGSLFAGCDETPGDIISPSTHSSRYKVYRGMASKDAQVGWRDNVDADSIVAEGESSIVPYKGPFAKVLHQLLGGLSSGMSYVGAETITELHKNAQFIRTSPHAVVENSPHGAKV